MKSETVARKRSVVVDGVGMAELLEKLVEVALSVEGGLRFEHANDIIPGETHRGAIGVFLDEIEVLFSKEKCGERLRISCRNVGSGRGILVLKLEDAFSHGDAGFF